MSVSDQGPILSPRKGPWHIGQSEPGIRSCLSACNNLIWWNGPANQQLQETERPNNLTTTKPNEHALTELTRNSSEVTHVLSSAEEVPQSTCVKF